MSIECAALAAVAKNLGEADVHKDNPAAPYDRGQRRAARLLRLPAALFP